MYPPHHNAGAEHMLHGMLKECVRRGIECRVAVENPWNDDFDYEIDGVRVGRPEILHGCDVILTHLDRTPDAERWCRMHRVPCVQLMHNHLRPKMARTCNLAVYNSDWLKADFPCRAAPHSIAIHPPIWVEDYLVAPRGKHITLINLSHAKGGSLFFELAEMMPDLEFLGVAGAYGPQEKCPKGVENVTIIKNQTDIRTVYRKTRVLLMPSNYETYGRVGMEAAVSGIPTVANPTKGLKEALGPAGIFPASLDVRTWEQAIRDTLKNWDEHSKKSAEWAGLLDPAYDVARFIGALECVT